MDMQRLKKQLTTDEGKRNKPYRDTVGKLTIGVGHNLDDCPISDTAIDMILQDDIVIAYSGLVKALPWVANLDAVRQEVLVNMCFNMGLSTLLTFKNTLGLVQAGKYDDAGNAMVQSKWYGQVGQRAERLVQAMEKGTW